MGVGIENRFLRPPTMTNINSSAFAALARTVSRLPWLPVRVRHWPYNSLDQFYQRKVRKMPLSCQAGLHFVFFTCRRHFFLLECAIASLMELHSPYVHSVYVFVDESDPLDTDQTAQLQMLCPEIQIELFPQIRGWGAQSASREINAFSKIARTLKETDYIVKADSDVLFIADWIFPLVLKSGADSVGDGRYIDFRFFQGGCYFLKRSAVRCLERYGNEAAIQALYQFGSPELPEDEHMYQLLRRENAGIWLTRYMSFPDEFRRFDNDYTQAAKRFCIMHFVKNKESLPRVFSKLMTRQL